MMRRQGKYLLELLDDAVLERKQVKLERLRVHEAERRDQLADLGEQVELAARADQIDLLEYAEHALLAQLLPAITVFFFDLTLLRGMSRIRRFDVVIDQILELVLVGGGGG